MKKQISVPFFPELDRTDMAEVGSAMENQGVPKQQIQCVNWPKEFPYEPITAFSVARSEQYLYIDYQVHGNCLLAIHTTNNAPVWQDSAVEFFARIPGREGYYNFEFNCIGTCLAAARKSREEAVHMSDEQIGSIRRYASAGKKPFKEMQGMFAWQLTVAVPFALLGLDGTDLPEKIDANFYKCADESSLPHYVSWSPIHTETPNFHCPEFFGELLFR